MNRFGSMQGKAMNLEILVAEGQRLAKPAALLTSVPNGPVAGRWYGYDAYEDDNFCILSWDASAAPNPELHEDSRLSLFVDEANCEGGYVAMSNVWPDRDGIPLFAHVEQVPAPLEAVLKFGSQNVQDWLKEMNWELQESGEFNYPYHPAPDQYFSAYQSLIHPLHREDVFAMIGGWHYPFPGGEWYQNLDSRLSVMTIRDSEPWVEVWLRPTGQFDVVHQVT